ncbi:hypothetical protein KQ945_06755 [Bacillus subtilis subsp. subtilis]|nr:hypothetical protein [Bacillus subtilis subsp. subtilis]
MSPVRLDVVGNDAHPDAVPLQPASQDIWARKYRLTTQQGEPLDADIDATYLRVATALADAEASAPARQYWRERFTWALRHGAIPAGRIISNAGAQAYKPATSTINCTVSGTLDDSMDGILRKVHEAGLTLKAGCGIGYEFSTLRPRGAYVAGAGAHTSGPLSFMDIFDRMCFTIASAGGRRGAQMGTFDVAHPDVREFIRAKREDGRLRQFNLSLLITDAFMQAVDADADWPLVFPLTRAEAAGLDLADPATVQWRDWPTHRNYVVRDDGLVACRVYGHLHARNLWDMIMVSTYDYAEPGFILIDRVNQMNNTWWCEDIRATNPCVTADTWVQTREGPRQVAELVGRPFQARVDGHDYPSTAAGFFLTAHKPVLAVQTRQGHRLRLTADHRVRRVTQRNRWTLHSQWCEAGQLQPGDEVQLHDHRACTDWPGALDHEQGFLLGLLMGDGTVQADAAVLSVWCLAAVANGAPATPTAGVRALMAEALRCARTLPHHADVAGWCRVAGRGEWQLKSAALRDLAWQMGMVPGHKTMTPALEKLSSAACRGFLRGLFDADGRVQGSQATGVSIHLARSGRACLEAVQRMLLRLGMPATLCARRADGPALPLDGHDGQRGHPRQARFELVIGGEGVAGYAARVGFADSDKAAQLTRALARCRGAPDRSGFFATVEAVQPDGVDAVFDVQVPGVHCFDANGLHAHNCGEQPLPPYGACLLGSINLTRFVREPFTDRARFDWEEYKEVVRVFTRMLDNVVEVNGLPLAQQRQEILRKRRHGMGFLGLGSTLAMLRMTYGDPASCIFTGDVAREMAIAGWETGLALAREKGPAPILLETFTVTATMLRQRPEMADDGWRVGQQIQGKVLHARYSRYMQRIAEIAPDLVQALAEVGARFTHHSSIAPTGTISLSLANNASNGIEPSFAHHYSRNVIVAGRNSKDKVDVFSYELLAYRQWINPQAMPFAQDAAAQLPDYFVAADDISPKAHVDIQAAAQAWVDSAISKTANVPTDYPFEQFKDIYRYAHQQGLKGCTTFRFNPAAFQGVLVKAADLENTTYRFELEDGAVVEVKGNEQIEYDGQLHTAANLFDALKEGYYGKY